MWTVAMRIFIKKMNYYVIRGSYLLTKWSWLQYLIYWNWGQRRHRKGIDCYWLFVSHMQIWSRWLDKTGWQRSCACVCTTVGMYGFKQNAREKKVGTTQECYVLFWANSENKTPTKQQLYGHLTPITQTIQVRWTRHSGH